MHTLASAVADGKAGPGQLPRTELPLCAICAQQQKSHETAASSRRCAESGGGPCAPGARKTLQRDGDSADRVPTTSLQLLLSVQVSFLCPLFIVISVRPSHIQDTTPCVIAMGETATLHHIFKQEVSAYLRRCTGHRHLHSSIENSTFLLSCRCYRSSVSVFPVNAVQLPLSVPSSVYLWSAKAHPRCVAACTRSTRNSRLMGQAGGGCGLHGKGDDFSGGQIMIIQCSFHFRHHIILSIPRALG